MRLRPLIVSVVLSAAFVAIPARAQDPERIVDQYIKTACGSKAISKIRTLTVEGTFTMPDGKTGTYTLDTRLPNRYYSEIVLADQNVIEAYNGKSAWHQTQSGEIATLLGNEGAQLEAAGQYYNSHLVNAKKNKLGIGFAATLKVRGKDAYDLELTTPTGVKRHVFFDPNSHLIVKEAAVIGGVEQEALYDDYRSVNGVKFPYKIELHRGNDVYDISVTRVAVNEPVGERVFDYPRKSQVQLPELKAFFKE